MIWVLAAWAVPPEQLPPGEPLRQLVGDHWRIFFPEGARPVAEEMGWRIAAEYADDPWDGRYTLVLNDASVDANRTLSGKIQPYPWTTFQWTGTQTFALPTGKPALISAEWAGTADPFGSLLQRDLGRRRAWRGAWGLGASLAWPSWYIEARTFNLEGGQSRWLRGGLAADRADLPPLSFDTAILGSLRRPIPGPRVVGRMLVEEDPDGARRAGDVATGPLIVVPGSLSFAWKAATGSGPRKTWKEALARAPVPQGDAFEPVPLQGPDAAPAVLASPVADGDAVIVFRYGLEDTGSILRVGPDGRAEILARTGPRVQERIGAGGGRVAWDEIRPHPRFAGKTDGVLRVRDPDGRIRDLAVGRLSSPAVSPDGRRIAAVWQSEAADALLVELDAETGVRLRMFSGEGELWLAPRYAPDGSICAMRRGVAGTSLVRVREDVETLVGPARADLVDPACTADEIVYAADGVLYATGREGTRRVVAPRTGAWSPAIGETSLWWVAPGPLGTELFRVPWPRESDPYAGFSASGYGQGRGRPPWTERGVSRVAHALDFHGSNVSTPQALTNTGVAGQVWDVTGSTAYYGDLVLDTNEGTPKIDLQARYHALPVRLGVQGRAGLRHYVARSHVAGAEAYVGGELGLPLDFSRGVWSRTLEVDVAGGAVWTEPWKLPFTKGERVFRHDRFPLGTVALTATQARRTAPRELLPPWSQRIQGWYLETGRGRYFAGQVAVTLPALRNGGLLVQAAGSINRIPGWRPATPFRFSRGYFDVDQAGLWRVSIDWRFPLAYPDLVLGPAYVTRLKGGLFYDHAQGTQGMSRSAGVELLADTSLIRLAPIDLGVRAYWRFDGPRGMGMGPMFSWRY